MTVERDTNAVKATRTAHEIVEVIKRQDGAGVTAIAEETGLSTSGVHKHLKTLADLNYVSKKEGAYHVGLRYLEFGAYARSMDPLYRIAKPEIHRLNRSTGTIATLVVRRGDECVYLYSVPVVDADPDVDLPEGIHAPIEACAPGEAMLAFTDAATSASLDVDERNHLKRIRNRRLAVGPMIGQSEYRTAAVPLLDDAETPIGAVAVSGPSEQFSRDRVERHTSGIIQDVVQTISQKLNE